MVAVAVLACAVVAARCAAAPQPPLRLASADGTGRTAGVGEASEALWAPESGPRWVGGGAPGGLSWLNPLPPDNATSPYEGAVYSYCRTESAAGFSGSRFTPVDLWIHTFDAQGRDITLQDGVANYLRSLHVDIYGWNETVWRRELARCCTHTLDINKTIDTKANIFWEGLASLFARRVLGHHEGEDPVMLFGPGCFNASGDLTCVDPGLASVAALTVTSRPDGHRDPINPVTRTISMQFRRPFDVAPVYYDVEVPNMLRVADPRRELLDVNPDVGGRRVASTLHIRARSPTNRTRFPDYNLMYLPVRHLVLQGAVANPRVPASSLAYPTLDALRARFESVAGGLFSAGTASRVVEEIRPFFTELYYYMYLIYPFAFDGRKGIPGYVWYLLDGPTGLAQQGIGKDIDQVQLVVGNATTGRATVVSNVRAR